jgi:hypothetical protein
VLSIEELARSPQHREDARADLCTVAGSADEELAWMGDRALHDEDSGGGTLDTRRQALAQLLELLARQRAA